MFIDYKDGRTRVTFEVGDKPKFTNPFEGIYNVFGLEIDEKSLEQKEFLDIEKKARENKLLGDRCISDFILKHQEVEVLRTFYYDPRKTHSLNIHKYAVKWKNKIFVLHETFLYSSDIKGGFAAQVAKVG